MDPLLNNINRMIEEITTKIKPENIKKGITIFGVTGTYEGGDTEEEPVIDGSED